MNKWDWSKDKLFSNSPVLKYILCEGDAFDPKLELPRRCNGDYYHDLKKLFEHYNTKYMNAKKYIDDDVRLLSHEHIERLCNGILETIHLYHNGFPARAYQTFANELSHFTQYNAIPYDAQNGPRQQRTSLFRMRELDGGCASDRSAIFHVPASLRHCLKSSRYSIAGYPSLYLTTSLSLAQRESNQPKQAIASRFEINRHDTPMVFDLGVRPQDFTFAKNQGNSAEKRRGESAEDNEPIRVSKNYIRNYLAWFPLLAACSFVRSHQNGGFSDEYIIPQLLLQWIRDENQPPANSNRYLIEPSKETENQQEEGYISIIQHIAKRILSLEDNCREFPEAKKPLTPPENSELNQLSDKILSLSNNLDAATQSLMSNLPNDIQARNISKMEKDLLKTCITSIDRSCYRLRNLINRLRMTRRNKDREQGVLLDGKLFSAMHRLFESKKRLDWLASRSKRIVGIRYFSCKDLYAPNLGRNYVFPTESCSLDSNGREADMDEEAGSYCALLNSLFIWTNPVKIEDFASLDECESHLKDCEQLENLHGQSDWQAMHRSHV